MGMAVFKWDFIYKRSRRPDLTLEYSFSASALNHCEGQYSIFRLKIISSKLKTFKMSSILRWRVTYCSEKLEEMSGFLYHGKWKLHTVNE